MSCNNITHISANMCNKICNDNIPASNTDQLTRCNTKCNLKIINELNPVDITNNFIFLNSADVAENALEIAGEESRKLYEEKKTMMNDLITNMEKEIEIKNAGCGIRIGAKWKKIIDGDKNNEFIDNDYIKKFKRYSAFGLKWKHVGITEPDTTKYIKLVKNTTISTDSYDYLNHALISGKDTQNNTILNKKTLIDNNLFLNDDTADFKIYPNSYIKLTDNTYCQVYDYSIIDISDAIVRDRLKSIFDGRGDIINLTDSVQKADIFKNAFKDLTMDDFVINDSGDIYIPSIGCSDFDNAECNDIENLLSENENCMVNNKDNDYIKRKDTIPYLFHNDSPSWCKTNALKFNNKNELFDIINLITYDETINIQLNEMMGKYEVDRYENIKTRINEILEGEYSQYFSTNDFLNLFNNDIQYWITIDDALFNQRSYRYNRANTNTGKLTAKATGTYVVGDTNIPNGYNIIAKILSNYIPAVPTSNHLIQLLDSDVEKIRTSLKSETISKKNLENILDLQDYFNIIDEDGNSTKVILYTPLYEHYDNREAIYYNSHLNFDDWSSKSGVDFYQHLNGGQKKIQNVIIGSYGQIGNEEGFYNNVILSDDYITKTECEAIKLNAVNTSNTIFLNENIENRHKLDKYRLNDIDFNDVNYELSQYDTNIGNLNRCLENSKTMINLDTYTKTKEYDNINQNIRDNAEINKKYNIYSSNVNKYDGTQTDCKLLSEYNNKDTCGISGEMCLSDDFISDTEYDTELQSKKDSLKSYIFNRQKNYYVGKNTLTLKPNTWKITEEYPNIGLELVNINLTKLLDNKYGTATNNIITLSDNEILQFSDSKIDNNTYISSSTYGHYYTVNLQQEICNQPNDYVLQNSESICGGDKQCAYENEYNNSISKISQYDDNLCTKKYNYLEDCYNQDPVPVMGKQVDYSVCSDDQQESPLIIDCPQTEDPQCPSGSYITYKIENGRYTCEKVCGSCVPNTTLNSSYSKCHANIGYYYDYEYDELESTSPPVPEQCQQGYYIDVTGAKTIEECNQCIPECDSEHYKTVDCTFSTNRVCTQLPENSTKNQNGIDFVCDVNYFKRGDQCVACPYETTSVQGSTSILECRANEGHYFDPESLAYDEILPIPASAEQCDDGTYCASGATSETSCPTNTTSVAGSSDISQCHALPGFYYNNEEHSEGQSCLPGHYCPGGSGSTIQNPCPANTYNSLPNQNDIDACIPCEYETKSIEGSEACTACPTIPIVPGDRSAIRQYKYYDYQVPGCETISTGICYDPNLSLESLNDDKCPTTTTITDAYGSSITKKQFYGYTGVVQRDTITGKPKLFPDDTIKHKNESQEELTSKLQKNNFGNFDYHLGIDVNHECEKTCISCLPNQKFIPKLSACDPCTDNKVASPDGLSCIPCNDKIPNTIYNAELGNCTLCNDYQIPNFNSNKCKNPEPGYYVQCDQDVCRQIKAELNKIVLGQINKVDWLENIKSIIFDYEQLTLGTVNDDIYIIFNVALSEYKNLKLSKKDNITNNKYYKDISQNIIIFENDTTSDTDYLIKFMESIYISNTTVPSSLPNKLILQTENDSYYLLTHRMQEDIANRYSTADIWDNSYLIFDMYLNITNEQYLCPDNTYIDDGTEIEADGSGINKNICKFYDSGYYRDIYSSSGTSSTDASSASTQETFTNYENFESRTQTTCLKDFTSENKETINITDSKLGAQSGINRAGCVYKCNTDGHYYNEGTSSGWEDNKCEPCPIGYKCDNLQNKTACIGKEYQNETGQTECKKIPTDGTAILQGLANIGFSVPEGKKYNNVDNTISDCSKNTYKDTISNINDQERERYIECLACPLNTTTKGEEGSTQLAQCIPNFGYTLNTTDGIVTKLTGYDDSSGSIQCAREYYLGDFVGDCDKNPNECTKCLDQNDKACIPCPTGYTCAGGSVDCKANPAIPVINAGHIDNEPLNIPIYTIDACLPGMKLTSGQCDPCDYTSGGSETGKYCFDGYPKDHISAYTDDDIKLKNNDNFTPAIYITAEDNKKYNINTIEKDTEDPKNIVFSFKNNYIPSNIEDYDEIDIENLKYNDIPLYLYEHASGEKNENVILNAKNVTQPVGNIIGNIIDLSKEGYINTKDDYNIIRNIILNNNLKFEGVDEKNALLDIIISYKADKLGGILDDMNLSFIYEFEYYDDTQIKIQSYVYRILPYHSVCDKGTHTKTGLINSCEYCPIGTYKSTADASYCQKAENNYYVGVNNLSVSGRSSGLGGITVSEMPDSLGFEMLTTSDGGNYGYKLRSGYGYTAPNGEAAATATKCGTTSFNEEEILINNTIDNTDSNYPCDSCPAITSLSSLSQTGLLRLETNSPTSTTATACDIKVCDTNYMNEGGVNTNFCKLKNCEPGHYFNESSNSCEICPVGHYCDGTIGTTDQSIIPTVDSHQKIECPVNTYNDTTGISLETHCITCPLNTSTNGSLGQTALENCIADSGYYFEDGASTATQCPTNTSTGDATGTTSITDCISNAGWYFNSSTDTKATICTSGNYCASGATSETRCPDNTTSPAGSSSFSDCRAIAGWYYPWNSADVSTSANQCPQNTYCEGANESAVNCPFKTNTRGGKGKTQKAECVADPGYYYDYTDQSHTYAIECPVGTYNPDYNKAYVSNCIKCPENTYNTNSGSSLVTDCQGCPPNTSTAYDDAGIPVAAGVETTGKSLLTDCKPGKMYERNSSSNEIILKTGHTKVGDQYMCDQQYYFDDNSGECVLCGEGFWCAGGPALSSGGASEVACPPYSTSSAGSSEIADCEPIPGYKRVDDTFVENEGVKTDATGAVVFKSRTDGLVQCLPGYKGEPGFAEECQSCIGGTNYSTDGNECLNCDDVNIANELVIRNCDTMNNTIKIDKSILRIESLDTVCIIQALNYELTVSHLYTNACIIPQTHTYPDYIYLLPSPSKPSPSKLYFIKLSKTYLQLPVEVGANIHSKVKPVEINDNVIEKGTSSYDNIIAFIPNITLQTKILDLCYFHNNGVAWEVFLLLPKCGCVPGTFGDNCYFCPTADAAGRRQQFQPYYNQDSCISVPTTILDDSYSFIQDETSTYNIGVNLNAGWAMNSSGESSLCAADTYYAPTTEITDQIVDVDSDYNEINCTNCPVGSGTQDRTPANGATAISDCTVKFGYKEKSPATTPATYGYDTGYEDVDADNIIDCKAGYYFDGNSCVECPAGYYCSGGVASNSGATATATPCPVGTYNTLTGSTDETYCSLCTPITDGDIELSQCDAFKNRFSAYIPNFMAITGGSGGTKIISCNQGFSPVYLDNSYEDEEIDINEYDDYYLYEFDAKILNDLEKEDSLLINENFHLNQNKDLADALNIIIDSKEPNLKIQTDDLNMFKSWVKKYTKNKGNNDDYKLQFYKDVNVYKNDRQVTMRYIYRILPLCVQCPDGSSNNGKWGNECKPCPAGTKQGKVNQDRVCINCTDNTYQDLEGKTVCKELPSLIEGYRRVHNDEGGIKDYNINSGYMWDGNNDVIICPKNTKTQDYGENGRIKSEALLENCEECPVNQYQNPSNKIECISCPPVGNNLGTAYYFNTDKQECTLCNEYEWDMNTPETGLGIKDDGWQLKTNVPVGMEPHMYCGAAPTGCISPLYTYDANNQMCKLNQCAAGEYFNGTVCEECPVGYYCPVSATQISQINGVWKPAKSECLQGTYQQNPGQSECSACPDNTNTRTAGSTNVDQCVANAGYYSDDSSGITQCPQGTYKNSVGYGACTQCGSGLTTSGTGSKAITDCIAASGYYATPGDGSWPNNAQACPGVPQSLSFPYKVPSIHGISTEEGQRTSLSDCIYAECANDYYRHEDGKCVGVTEDLKTNGCPGADDIFVEYRKSGGGTRYSNYYETDISNYDATNHIWGHDNLCLPISDICTA